MSLWTVLSYPPVLRGFLALLLAGAFFPLTGVFILRMNLVTLRFTLMHGALLGAALGLALQVGSLPIAIALDLLIVLTHAPLARRSGLSLGYVSAFFMVLTIGLTFAVIYRAGIPSKDVLGILWGNVYALSPMDLAFTAAVALAAPLLLAVYGRKVSAVLLDREIAFSAGVNTPAVVNGILAFTGVTVAFSMQLIGALLLDSLLLLPAIVATFYARSARGVFVLASLTGLACSVLGFASSVALDVPVSASIAVTAAVVLAAGMIFRRRRKASHETPHP